VPAAIPNPPRKSMSGLGHGVYGNGFHVIFKSFSFSRGESFASYFSMPNALTMRVPEIVSCKRELMVPMVICVDVVTLRIFLPKKAIG